jgi:P27 family predicted phage terminase small subunit
MPAGRKRLPTKFHVLNGTDRPCRRNNGEPMPDSEIDIPKPPMHLSASAKKEWKRMSKVLHSTGLLTQLDYSQFAIYCQAWGRWVDAEKKITENSMVVKTANGNPINNPYMNIANTAMRDCHKFLSEFGMTPSSRTKIKIDNQTKKQNKFTSNAQQANS